MTFFPDMGTLTLVAAGPAVRAVGWLDPDYPFTTGEPPEGLVDCLERFVSASETSGVCRFFRIYLGRHDCEFCHDRTAMGVKNIGVPFGDVIFIAPDLVVHYVSRHKYCPPRDFIIALQRSPLPGTAGYQMALSPFLTCIEPSADDERQISEASEEWRRRRIGRRWP